eukprot:TRINITY_DN4278_c0_g1_i4.p1 TRINITY_DN4278_c0_g1~~TRINITY_DN4278_c0_g1_i4.p1  ORF type:complete len:546 (+),score=106.53 TRINITY_DN4278_c0_g1_i4:75-1712(+)
MDTEQSDPSHNHTTAKPLPPPPPPIAGLAKPLLYNSNAFPTSHSLLASSIHPSIHNSESTLHNPQSNIHNSQSTLHNSQSNIHNSQSTLHNPQSNIHNSQSTLHNSQSNIHNSQSTLHNSQSNIHNSQSTLHNPQSNIHNSQSTLHNPQSNIHNSPSTFSVHKVERRCFNCGATKTRQFYSGPDGQSLCDPCGQWYRRHHTMRPQQRWAHQSYANPMNQTFSVTKSSQSDAATRSISPNEAQLHSQSHSQSQSQNHNQNHNHSSLVQSESQTHAQTPSESLSQTQSLVQMRPSVQPHVHTLLTSLPIQRPASLRECSNCGPIENGKFCRGPDNTILCNACAQWYKRHNNMRPLHRCKRRPPPTLTDPSPAATATATAMHHPHYHHPRNNHHHHYNRQISGSHTTDLASMLTSQPHSQNVSQQGPQNQLTSQSHHTDSQLMSDLLPLSYGHLTGSQMQSDASMLSDYSSHSTLGSMPPWNSTNHPKQTTNVHLLRPRPIPYAMQVNTQPQGQSGGKGIIQLSPRVDKLTVLAKANMLAAHLADTIF